jgi:N-acetylglucosaminyldiphosphoundecaprenol N-acetyl-beta-D-mannosaminyltransferase
VGATATERPPLPARCFVWDLPVVVTDPAGGAELVAELALRRQGGYVCLCNVHVLVESRHDDDVCDALTRATLVFADGWPVAWLQRRAGEATAARVAGADLMARVFGLDRGLRHFLLGATDAVVRSLQEELVGRFPAARVVGALAPGDGGRLPAAADVATISRADPHIVWVALGAPKQELWMRRQAADLAPALAIGVGAAFDFLAGTKPRAPGWMQQTGLEWLHRLTSEPRRLAGRYARTNSEFVFRVATGSGSRRGAA